MKFTLSRLKKHPDTNAALVGVVGRMVEAV